MIIVLGPPAFDRSRIENVAIIAVEQPNLKDGCLIYNDMLELSPEETKTVEFRIRYGDCTRIAEEEKIVRLEMQRELQGLKDPQAAVNSGIDYGAFRDPVPLGAGTDGTAIDRKTFQIQYIELTLQQRFAPIKVGDKDKVDLTAPMFAVSIAPIDPDVPSSGS